MDKLLDSHAERFPALCGSLAHDPDNKKTVEVISKPLSMKW
jgi:hypothetical protein